jgi:hypothetical protein
MDAPAGWYPDPRDPRRIRWWDGTGWTETTQPAPTGAEAPPAATTPAAEPARRSPVLPLVVGIVAFVLLAGAAAAILLGQRTSQPTARADGSPSSAPSTAPSPSTSGSAGATPEPASTEGGALGTTLETFRPADGFISPGLGSELIENGDLTSEPTLDGWCSTSYATEKDRLARRQWVVTLSGQKLGTSIEVVAYGTEAQAKAALAEFVARTKACTDATVEMRGSTQTQDLVRSGPLKTAAGISGYAGETVITGTENGTAFTVNSSGLIQQRGRYVSIIWAGQQTPFSDADRQVIEQFRQQQADALLAATG